MSTAAAKNGSWVCMPSRHFPSRGIFFGDSPFSFGTPVLLAQLSLSSLLTAFLQRLLTPIGQSSFISQMLVGLALGPSFFGRNFDVLDTIFTLKSYYISETFAFFGCMLFMFLVGVKMDLTILTQSGTKPVVIGLCAFFVPLTLNLFFSMFLQRTMSMESHLKNSLISIAAFQSSSSFHVIACYLADLKLLNSELGRLAISSAMVSGTLTWISLIVGFTIRQTSMVQQDALLWMTVCVLCLIVLVVYLLRPIMFWMITETNNSGRAIKESYIFWLFVMVLFCSLFSEFIGQHFMLGPMILGLAVPDGPPLGSALVEKLESFVSAILLPGYFVFSGARIDLSSIHMRSAVVVHLMAFCSFMGKVIGTMVPSIYNKMSLLDSFILGLIMSTQGITDILILQHGMMLLMLDQKSYSIMVISIVVMTGTVSPIVKILYNPSKKYRSGRRRRTMEHSNSNSELRLLACIHHQDNTPSIINLLELSNPSLRSPICLYVVHLIQLTGRSSPLLINHRPAKQTSIHFKLSAQIINAFQLYQECRFDKVIMNAFTSVAPYATMHDDVCMLALEKTTAMVIIPFHTHSSQNGIEESTNHVRGVNRNILSKAPCSVGILVDRGNLPSTASVSNRVNLYRIGMIFLEGPDDREALAYATRMAEQPNVNLTVVRFIESENKFVRRQTDHHELDLKMIKGLRTAAMAAGRKNIVYQEKVVEDCVMMVSMIRAMENSFDLIMVGRRHDNESSLFIGLNEWNEFPELGFIGDMLASSDSSGTTSVLVVQQQTIGSDQEILEDFRCLMEESFSVDMAPLKHGLNLVRSQ